MRQKEAAIDAWARSFADILGLGGRGAVSLAEEGVEMLGGGVRLLGVAGGVSIANIFWRYLRIC